MAEPRLVGPVTSLTGAAAVTDGEGRLGSRGLAHLGHPRPYRGGGARAGGQPGGAKRCPGGLARGAIGGAGGALKAVSEVGWGGGAGMPASRSSTSALSRVSRVMADGPASLAAAAWPVAPWSLRVVGRVRIAAPLVAGAAGWLRSL